MATTIISTPLNNYMGIPPVSSEAAANNVYFGSSYSYTPGAAATVPGGKGTSGRGTVTAVDEFHSLQDAYGWYGSLDEGGRQALEQVIAIKFQGMPYNKSWVRKTASEGVALSNFALQNGERISPLEALWRTYVDNDTSLLSGMGGGAGGAGGGGAGGGGGGGGYTGPVASVNLTDPGTAKTLINNALSTYLGRKASSKEVQRFTTALNESEMQNPTISNRTPSSSVTTGGFNPATFAEEYAQAEEGAAEYQAATTFLDTFISTLKNPVQVV